MSSPHDSNELVLSAENYLSKYYETQENAKILALGGAACTLMGMAANFGPGKAIANGSEFPTSPQLMAIGAVAFGFSLGCLVWNKIRSRMHTVDYKS